MKLEDILEALSNSWSPETAQDGLSERGPASGQCAVSSGVIRALYGGTILRGTTNNGIVHYWNELPDGQWIDSTRSQFTYDEWIMDMRESRLEDFPYPDTMDKFLLLFNRVIKYLKEKDARQTP